MAPQNKDLWDPKWVHCQSTWLRAVDKAKESGCVIEYRMWTDEDLDTFVQTEFPDLYGIYQRYPFHIMRIDFARYLILYAMGGVYADMDYEFCEQRGSLVEFFEWLQSREQRVFVVGSPWEQNERVQNSLMASAPMHPFWQVVIKEAIAPSCAGTIIDVTGPKLLDRCIEKEDVGIFDVAEFNPSDEQPEAFASPQVWTRHHRTMVWFKRGGSALGR